MLSNTEKDINLQLSHVLMHTEIINQYSLKIKIASIYWLKVLTDTEIVISVYNPLNQTFYTTVNNIETEPDGLTYLENIKCRLNLEAPIVQIKNLLASWSPIIFISNKTNKILTQTSLDLNIFKLEKSEESFFITSTLFNQDIANEKLGEINLILTVRDNNMKVSTCEKTGSVPIFFQISEQLERWKQQQKELFNKEELERIKQWEKEKNELQSKLIRNIQDTNNALQNIRTERDNLKNMVDKGLLKHNIKQKPKSTDDKVVPKKDAVEEQKHDDSHLTQLVELMGNLKLKLSEKNSEIVYLKEQWAKTTRQLNMCRKEKHNGSDLFQPLTIRRVLEEDAAQQEKDLEELNAIKQELAKEKATKTKNQSNLIDILLKTNTYSENDRVIKLLQSKPNK